jgi:glycosyltransferase involved in cell wall biosynthesis
VISFFLLLKFISKRYDLIYSYNPALLMPWILKKVLKCVWVYDLQINPIAQERNIWHNNYFTKIASIILYKFKEISYKLCLKNCDLVIVLSEALKTATKHELNINTQKMYIQSLGVDTELFRPNQQSKDKFIIVYMSSIATYRGFQNCIKAAEILQNKDIHFEMWFIGKGQNKKDEIRLKYFTSQKACKDKIKWLGYIPHGKLPKILNYCSVALSPLPDIEAYRVSSPAKVFEYMAMGLPVIATNIEAHRVLIEDKVNGLFIKPEDPYDLADKILYFYENKEQRREMGENAIKSTMPHDWRILTDNLNKKLLITLENSKA